MSTPVEPDPAPVEPVETLRPTLVLLGTTLITGLLVAWLWASLTPLPGYTVKADGGAFTSERGLTQFAAGDVVFCAIGLPAGVGLGVVAWRAYGRRLGWPTVPIGAAAALVAAVICWQVGELTGGADFSTRLAAAQPGEVVAIDLVLRARVAVVVWVLGACGVQLVATAVLPDPEDATPLRLPWTAAQPTAPTIGPPGQS